MSISICKAPPVPGVCENCAFWHRWTEQKNPNLVVGDCRLKGPNNFQIEGSKFITKWPSTRNADYCGEFKLKGGAL